MMHITYRYPDLPADAKRINLWDLNEYGNLFQHEYKKPVGGPDNAEKIAALRLSCNKFHYAMTHVNGLIDNVPKVIASTSTYHASGHSHETLIAMMSDVETLRMQIKDACKVLESWFRTYVRDAHAAAAQRNWGQPDDYILKAAFTASFIIYEENILHLKEIKKTCDDIEKRLSAHLKSIGRHRHEIYGLHPLELERQAKLRAEEKAKYAALPLKDRMLDIFWVFISLLFLAVIVILPLLLASYVIYYVPVVGVVALFYCVILILGA